MREGSRCSQSFARMVRLGWGGSPGFKDHGAWCRASLLQVNKNNAQTVDGCEIHFAPAKKPWLKPIFVGIYRGNHHSRASERWCEVDFATIHRSLPRCPSCDRWVATPFFHFLVGRLSLESRPTKTRTPFRSFPWTSAGHRSKGGAAGGNWFQLVKGESASRRAR